MPDRSEWYTTLEALKQMAEKYLRSSDPEIAEAWKPPFKGDVVPLRPTEEELEKATLAFEEFLTNMQALPVFAALEKSDDTTKELGRMRAFPDEHDADGRGHLLLRPIGQQILAEAVGRLVDPKRSASERMSLSEVFEVLAELDRNGRFEAHLAGNVWYGVTYNFQRNKMDTTLSHQALAVALLMYLVRGGDEKERRRLLQELIKARHVEGEWRTFSGERVKVEFGPDGNPKTNGHSLPPATR